jgi:pimeloyl-ACP methyl ester carboxylesterase
MTVVFVHGFLSSAGAWRHKNGTYWPKLLAEDLVTKKVGVYSFEYETDFFSGTYRLGDAVAALEARLRLDKVLGCKRLVFVCHSMGGIVVRRFIIRHQTELIDQSKEIGLFLIASPSLGSEYAAWLRPLARLFKHSQADVLRFCETNHWLLDLDDEFFDLKEQGRVRINGKELIEDKFIVRGIPWLRPVVPEFTGRRYFGKSYKVPGSTHFTIASVAGPNSDQHGLLVEFLTKFTTPKSDLGFSAVLGIDSYSVRCPLSLSEYDEVVSLTKNAFPEEVLIDLDSDRLAFLRNPFTLVGVFDNTGRLRGYVDIYHLTESDLEEFLNDTTGEVRIDPERLLPYELARAVPRAYVATILVPGAAPGRPLAALLYGFMLFLTKRQFHNTDYLELFSIGHSPQGAVLLHDHLGFKCLHKVPMPDGEPKELFCRRFSKPELEDLMATWREKWRVFSYSTFEIR